MNILLKQTNQNRYFSNEKKRAVQFTHTVFEHKSSNLSNLRSTGIFFRWGSEDTVGKDAVVELLQISSSRDKLESDSKCPLYDSGTTVKKVSSVVVGFRLDLLGFPCWVRFRIIALLHSLQTISGVLLDVKVGCPSKLWEHNSLCSLDRSERSFLCAVLIRFSSKSESLSDLYCALLPMARSPSLLSSPSRDRSPFSSLYKMKWKLLF